VNFESMKIYPPRINTQGRELEGKKPIQRILNVIPPKINTIRGTLLFNIGA